jgi:hypothetical protein
LFRAPEIIGGLTVHADSFVEMEISSMGKAEHCRASTLDFVNSGIPLLFSTPITLADGTFNASAVRFFSSLKIQINKKNRDNKNFQNIFNN